MSGPSVVGCRGTSPSPPSSVGSSNKSTLAGVHTEGVSGPKALPAQLPCRLTGVARLLRQTLPLPAVLLLLARAPALLVRGTRRRAASRGALFWPLGGHAVTSLSCSSLGSAHAWAQGARQSLTTRAWGVTCRPDRQGASKALFIASNAILTDDSIGSSLIANGARVKFSLMQR